MTTSPVMYVYSILDLEEPEFTLFATPMLAIVDINRYEKENGLSVSTWRPAPFDRDRHSKNGRWVIRRHILKGL